MSWISHLPILLISSLGGFLHAGPVLEIKNKAGKSISAELISLDGDHVKMRKSAGRRDFIVPLHTLDPKSATLIRKEAAAMPEVMPDIEIDVSVSTRRRKDGKSTYVKAMTVGGKVIIENEDLEHKFPASKARIVFVGQDQRYPEKYQVLGTQDFDFSISPGATFELELKEFVTRYDSDNKGVGNWGGYKYEGYLLILYNDEKKVTHQKTVYATMSKAISDNPQIPRKFLDVKVGKMLTKEMTP